MLLSTVFFVLSAPLLVFSKIVIGNIVYQGNGTVVADVTEYTDAPPSFGLSVVNSANTSTPILNSIISESGVYTFQLPNLAAGTYMLQAVDGSGNILSTSKTFTVGASDFSSTVTAATYSVSSTGTAKPFITTSAVTVNSTTSVETFTVFYSASVSVSTPSATPSASLFTTETVFTSGSITTTITETGSVSVTPTPSPVTISAATATPSTKKSGAASQKGVVGVVAPVLGAVVVGAMLF